jgi:phage shock protein A
MGLFSRFKRAVKSNINDMISKAENPEKMLNQLILEMNEQLIESKKTVAAAIADEKKLERQMAANREQAGEWERKAMVAVNAGKDEMAKEALLRKQEFDNTARQYQAQWQAQADSVQQLKGALRQLQQKIEEAQRKKNLLIARAKRAEAQKRMQQTMSTMVDTSAFEVFDRMSEKVEQIEAEVDAMREIDATAGGDSLERQFQALEASESSADKMLEDLKAKMAQLEDKTDQNAKPEG